jgi:GntR family transcriptional regulator
MPFEIIIDRNSSVPPHEQIKDRVKVALALGTLRPGDNLPSIRQLEARIHVGTAIIRRAYRELAGMGILDLQHGRGVFIKNGIRQQAAATVREYESLYELASRELDRLNLVPSSFARFFYGRVLDAERQAPSVAFVEDSRTLSSDYVAQLGREWQIPIRALTLSGLRELKAIERAELHRVLTSYYHVDEVREIMRKHRAKVIPVDVEFHADTMNELRSLPGSSRVLFVLLREDFGHLSAYVTSFLKKKFGDTGIRFDVVSSADVVLPQVLRGKKYPLVFVSNRIWDELGEEQRSARVLRRPRLQLTQQSIKSAWGGIGVV